MKMPNVHIHRQQFSGFKWAMKASTQRPICDAIRYDWNNGKTEHEPSRSHTPQAFRAARDLVAFARCSPPPQEDYHAYGEGNAEGIHTIPFTSTGEAKRRTGEGQDRSTFRVAEIISVSTAVYA